MGMVGVMAAATAAGAWASTFRAAHGIQVLSVKQLEPPGSSRCP